MIKIELPDIDEILEQTRKDIRMWWPNGSQGADEEKTEEYNRTGGKEDLYLIKVTSRWQTLYYLYIRPNIHLGFFGKEHENQNCGGEIKYWYFEYCRLPIDQEKSAKSGNPKVRQLWELAVANDQEVQRQIRTS